MKKKVIVCSLIISVLLLSGCVGQKSALSGKNTDERIVMCLENAYPEHHFSIVSSFDESEGKGVYTDDEGIEFYVQNITYNNTYHFGCSDGYLKTLLENQNYIDKVTDIVSKYDFSFIYDDSYIRVNTCDSDNIADISMTIYEILNCVNVPELNWPREQGFSTGVVNYYTVPDWGVILCRCESGNNAANAVFNFGDVKLTQEEIEQQILNCYERIK